MVRLAFSRCCYIVSEEVDKEEEEREVSCEK